MLALCNQGTNELSNLCALCLNCHGQKYHDKQTEKKEGQSRFFNQISSIFFNYLKFILNSLYKKKYVLSR